MRPIQFPRSWDHRACTGADARAYIVWGRVFDPPERGGAPLLPHRLASGSVKRLFPATAG